MDWEDLALCGGAEGGEATEFFKHLECQRKVVGWVFKTNDPFIMNFGVFNGTSLYEDPPEGDAEIDTMKPAITLIVGLVASVLALLSVLLDTLGADHGMAFDMSTGAAAMLGVCITSAHSETELIEIVGGCFILDAFFCVAHEYVGNRELVCS
jgi:hypothetical protein